MDTSSASTSHFTHLKQRSGSRNADSDAGAQGGTKSQAKGKGGSSKTGPRTTASAPLLTPMCYVTNKQETIVEGRKQALLVMKPDDLKRVMAARREKEGQNP